MDWLVTILYGFFTGFGQLLPVSVSAHDYFLTQITRFDPEQPLLLLWIHLATFGALFLFYRRRAAHILRQIRIRDSRRPADMGAVLDGQVVRSMLLPAILGLVFAGWLRRQFGTLPSTVFWLILSGAAIYIPHFLPTGNRDSNHISRLEAMLFGLLSAVSAIPGLSRLGAILSFGSLRGCSRTYLMDVVMLMLLPLLLVQILLDLIALMLSGLAALSLLYWLRCVLAGVAAFGGACLGIGCMRFLAVERGYTAFAYFNWGLGIFGFILYLMI